MEKIKKIDSGGFADIYKISEGKVLKAYRRKSHAHRQEINMDDHDLVTLAHFRAEARTYEKIQQFDDIKIYTPKYYGRADPFKYITEAQDLYVKDCGLILELIPGIAKKLHLLDESIKEKAERTAEKIGDLMSNINVWDACFFKPGSGSEFTLIDFALWESEKYECYLSDNYSLSSELRIELMGENND